MMEMIRLMLVDDHEVVRTSLKTYLETQQGLRVVAEADNGLDALRLANQLHPDVVLMDITMPGVDGLEATREMSRACPESRVLALTVHEDKQYFFEMLAAGASGYVTKQVAAEELVAAIRTVAAGEVYLQPALAVWLLEDYRRLLNHAPDQRKEAVHPPGKGLEVLSERELQVLELVAEGLSNQEIGERLGISPKTVSRHRERIMSKLKIHSCAELVRFAVRSGLIDLRQ